MESKIEIFSIIFFPITTNSTPCIHLTFAINASRVKREEELEDYTKSPIKIVVSFFQNLKA